MNGQQAELCALVAFQIGAYGKEYNPVVIFDTVSILYQRFSRRDLKLMITGEHPEFCGIAEIISLILCDTYSIEQITQ